MAVKLFNTRIKLKTDSTTNWSTNNPSLLVGEFGWDSNNDNFKIGSGNWNSLNYAIPIGDGTEITTTTTNNFKTLAIGSIDGSKITSLTGYTLSGISGDVAASDSLEMALAKIEVKANAAAAAGVQSIDTRTGAFTTGTYLSTDSSNGIDIDSNKIDSNYTTASSTNLATVATVTTALDSLDVTGYAQGSIAAASGAEPTTSVITIKGIKEEDGKIANDANSDATINVDGVYNASTNMIATQSTVTSAINGLDTSTVATATTASVSGGTGTVITLKGVKETNGIIAQGSGDGTVTIGDGALKLSGYGATANSDIPTVSATDVFSANDTADSTIALSNAFILDATNKTIGIRTNTALSATNNIATMNDIASLTGAMHYKGALASDSNWPSTTEAGDVWVVTSGFTHSGTTLETGDMIVFSNDQGAYNVVQTNMTLGTDLGQVATNSAALINGNIVVASATGVETSSYTVANIASQATSLSESSGTITVSDTLTVGGTAQTPQTFTITGGNVLTASLNGSAITIDHDTVTAPTAPTATSRSQGDTVTVMTGITEDGYGHVTEYTTDQFTIPNVYDATLTISDGTNTDQIFSANANTNATVTFTGSTGITTTVGNTDTVTIGHSNSVTAVNSPQALKVAYDAQGHITSNSKLTASDVEYTGSGSGLTADDVQEAIDQVASIAAGAVQAVKTLDTTATAAQTPASAEVLEGTGSITLHKIAKTANPADLIQPSSDMIIFDCGSATTNISGESGAIAPNASTPNA